ncbi:MAG: acyltransferase [Bacteroidales bacterium]
MDNEIHSGQIIDTESDSKLKQPVIESADQGSLIVEEIKDWETSERELPLVEVKISNERVSWRLDFLIKKIIPCCLIALIVALTTYKVSSHFFKDFYASTIIISALDERNEASTGTEITFRGASVDGRWYNVGDILLGGGWTKNEEAQTLTWHRDMQDYSMTINLPHGAKRSVTFNTGPDQGRIKVEINGEILVFDLYNKNTVGQGLAYDLPVADTSGIERIAILVATTTFVLALSLFLILCQKRDIPEPKNERDVWGDLLRGICAFVIVWLHSTCNLFYSFGNSVVSWYPDLVVTSFTAFAVPCFYMLSGAYLLRREHSIRETLTKRVPKILIPLLFWSVIYIFVDHKPIPESLFKMFFQNQASHLWFMYSLLSIYILLPLLSRIYKGLDKQQKIYILLIFLVFPGLLHDFEYLTNWYVTMPYFALFWPDLGLFFLGGIIWDARKNLSQKSGLCVLGILIGLFLTVGATYYRSMQKGIPDNSFISCIGSVGVVLMAASFFSLALSLENKLQSIGMRTRNAIHLIGNVSMGVYFIHVLVIHFIGTQTLFGFKLTSNSGNQLNMLAGAVMYFAVSVLICWSGKKIPIVRRLF